MILIAILVAIAALVSEFREKRIVKKRLDGVFEGREELDPESFYETYFRQRGTSKDVVVRVRRILDDELGYDLSRLSAEDDLLGNLSVFFEHDSLLDVELVMRLEEEFGIKIEDKEAEKARTIRDIISLVVVKMEKLPE